MSNIYKVIWMPEAQQEPLETLDTITMQWSQKVLSKLITDVDHTIRLLEKSPYYFQVADDFPKVRRAVILKLNSLYYRVVEDNRVEILSFFQNRTDPDDRNL